MRGFRSARNTIGANRQPTGYLNFAYTNAKESKRNNKMDNFNNDDKLMRPQHERKALRTSMWVI